MAQGIGCRGHSPPSPRAEGTGAEPAERHPAGHSARRQRAAGPGAVPPARFRASPRSQPLPLHAAAVPTGAGQGSAFTKCLLSWTLSPAGKLPVLCPGRQCPRSQLSLLPWPHSQHKSDCSAAARGTARRQCLKDGQGEQRGALGTEAASQEQCLAPRAQTRPQPAPSSPAANVASSSLPARHQCSSQLQDGTALAPS